MGKRRVGLAVDNFQITLDDRLPVIGFQISITRQRLLQLVIIQHFFEKILRHAHNNIAIHLNKAAIAVPRKARITGMGGQRGYSFIVQAKVQHRVHHAGHRGARARAHRHKQRRIRIAKGDAQRRAHLLQRRAYFGAQRVGQLPVMLIEIMADIRRQGKSRRHWQTKAAHFSEICPLTAEQFRHASITFGRAVSELINPPVCFAHISPFR